MLSSLISEFSVHCVEFGKWVTVWALPHEYVIGYSLLLTKVKAKGTQLQDSTHMFSVIKLR